MSAGYEQRREIVVTALWGQVMHHNVCLSRPEAYRLAEVALNALDHIPEKLDWVCEGQPRDQVTKGVS